MNNAVYLRWGRLFYALAILAIGIVHIVTRNFPVGLLPVPATVPLRITLIYITGCVLIVAGALLLIKKYTGCGAYLASGIWLILLLAVHVPPLITDLHNPVKWTPVFEIVALLSGAFMLAYNKTWSYLKVKGFNYKLAVVGRYLFLVSLIVFTVQHYLYAGYIATLIPAWLPGHMFWAYLVLLAFFLASVSLLINKQVRLASLLLALMFFIWFLILHLPRVVASYKAEPEWTSMFIVLAMSGISLLIASSTKE